MDMPESNQQLWRQSGKWIEHRPVSAGIARLRIPLHERNSVLVATLHGRLHSGQLEGIVQGDAGSRTSLGLSDGRDGAVQQGLHALRPDLRPNGCYDSVAGELCLAGWDNLNQHRREPAANLSAERRHLRFNRDFTRYDPTYVQTAVTTPSQAN